jgi:hypothetical protein
MAWIKVDHQLERKPEVLILAALLGKTVTEIVGLCVRFWIWADTNTVDGRVRFLSAPRPVSVRMVSGGFPVPVGEDQECSPLDAMLSAPGFTAAMVQVGWLTHENDELIVPDWDSHNSQSAKARALEAKRKGIARAHDGRLGVRSASGSCPDSVRFVSGSQPDVDGTRPDRDKTTGLVGSSPTRSFSAANPSSTSTAQRRSTSPAARGNGQTGAADAAGPTGASAEGGGEKRSIPHIEREDLIDGVRLKRLHSDCAARGLCGSSEAALIAFAALAQYALRKSKTPARFMGALVRDGHWDYAGAKDEDAAARILGDDHDPD